MYTKINKIMTLDDYKDKKAGLSNITGFVSSGVVIAKGINSLNNASNSRSKNKHNNDYEKKKAKIEIASGSILSGLSALGTIKQLKARSRAKRNRSTTLYRMIQSGELDIADALNYYWSEPNKKFKAIMRSALVKAGVDPDSGADKSAIIGQFRKARR